MIGPAKKPATESGTVNERSINAIAERLIATREALGYDQSEYADIAKIARNTYNQYERAKGRPQLDEALKLCETFNLTLDWIYRGDPSGLPMRIATVLFARRPNRPAT